MANSPEVLHIKSEDVALLVITQEGVALGPGALVSEFKEEDTYATFKKSVAPGPAGAIIRNQENEDGTN